MRSLITLFLVFCSFAAVAQDSTRLRMVFVGDLMQHESQMKAAFDPSLGAYDYSVTFRDVKHIITGADLAIGNLELTFGGKPYTGYPAFSAPDDLLPAIKDAGFDALVTANNHSMDRGRRGVERTIHYLDSLGIPHTGTFTDTLDYLNNYPLIIEQNGFRISLLNYTYGTNGIAVTPPVMVNHIDTTRIKADLTKAKQQTPDVIIVFFHWGAEYNQSPSLEQLRVARLCLRNGARLVVGSHPHVLQPMEWDCNTDQLVAYSLGNFISGQRVRYRNGGAFLHVTLEKQKTVDGRDSVRLADVSYSLAWMHRQSDARKTFQLIPVRDEQDTIKVSGKNSRALMRQFIKDSRGFLDAKNRNVPQHPEALSLPRH
jgi:poly-gamma-glutamate capsule biosynthesis protein CapA/YwtB (metallophosphatase superfamily)